MAPGKGRDYYAAGVCRSVGREAEGGREEATWLLPPARLSSTAESSHGNVEGEREGAASSPALIEAQTGI